MFKLHGVYAPIATPFTGGKIAYDKLEKNLKFWLESDLEGIVVMGSNGEFVLLSPEEKEELTRFVCAQAKGKKPVIAGTGAESTADTIAWAEGGEAGGPTRSGRHPEYTCRDMTIRSGLFYNDVPKLPAAVVLYNMPRNAGITFSAKLAVEWPAPEHIGIRSAAATS
jgi:4-hydroxy-2-oxoglutarate aldolase